MADKNWMKDAVSKEHEGAFRRWCIRNGYVKANGEPDTRAGASDVMNGKINTSERVKRMASLAQTFAKYRK